jgi:hypothetical protein
MQIPGFLQDETTRTIIGWLGAGLVAIIAAGWAIFKFRHTNARKPPAPAVSADNGSVSVGRDIRDSKIETHSDRKR